MQTSTWVMKCEAFSHLNVWSEVRCGKIASGLIQSRRSPKCQNSTEKRQRAPRDLFHPIKPCLGLAIGRYIGESNHQAADCRPSEASLQLPWQAKQGLLYHASRTWMDMMGMVARLSIWWISNMKESVFHRGEVSFQNNHFTAFLWKAYSSQFGRSMGFQRWNSTKKNV